MATTIAMATVAMRTACSLHLARINAEIFVLDIWNTKTLPWMTYGAKVWWAKTLATHKAYGTKM